MNLKEFIDYKHHCPLCNFSLKTLLHSDRRQSSETDIDSVSFVFTVLPAAIQKLPRYKVKYIFNLYEPKFRVEFFNEANKYIDAVSLSRIQSFVYLHNNLKAFRFLRVCSRCARYEYVSHKFDLALGQVVPAITPDYEVYCLQHTIDDEYTRAYQLINSIETKRTLLGFWKEDGISESCNYARERNPNGTYIDLSLIPFVSKEETVERLNNLLIFT